MSTLAIILIALAAIILVIFAGGLIASRRRTGPDYERHVAAADQALEQARAADRGWDRDVLERTAREALASERGGWSYDNLHLVLVDDRPGVTEDRAVFAAVGDGEEVRVALVRGERGWALERLE